MGAERTLFYDYRRCRTNRRSIIILAGRLRAVDTISSSTFFDKDFNSAKKLFVEDLSLLL